MLRLLTRRNIDIDFSSQQFVLRNLRYYFLFSNFMVSHINCKCILQSISWEWDIPEENRRIVLSDSIISIGASGVNETDRFNRRNSHHDGEWTCFLCFRAMMMTMSDDPSPESFHRCPQRRWCRPFPVRGALLSFEAAT
ncbi:hypothetical protein NPIL_568891 [Nephila pilipes]|uniref:Uncharacterized protein n=1 Tax=Nephila pilipes TaxID=299642 RepID=A0A8X6R354_NEPPI|nr:hypothetical protein NPIL_568891 [Nephila pilipes]